MPKAIAPALRSLLTAMNLGRSTRYPLAGWTVLSMLYRDGSTASEPMTLGYLVTRYNAEYLEPGDKRIADDTLRSVLKILVEQAQLVNSSTRRVRERMSSGKYHITQSAIYRINAAGIEYLKSMQRVIDAENTVVASTKRIDEYVQLLNRFRVYRHMSVDSMSLYEDFNRLLEAYDAVMNGLRKLDVDLHDISTDLAFDRVSDAADHLRTMLHQEAVPAYQKMIDLAPLLQWLLDEDEFANMVAISRQAKGNLDVAVALDDEAALEVERHQTTEFVQRRLGTMVQSFDPSTTAIQTSFDSIYLLYQTLISTSSLLAREYEQVRKHTIDIQALTANIDDLLTKTSQLSLPQSLPVHLPMDRLSKDEMASIEELPISDRADALADLTTTVRLDMLEAGSMGAVTRSITSVNRQVVSAADNPEVATDADLAGAEKAAMAEFSRLVMTADNEAQVTADVEFTTALARDAVVALYPATQYAHPGAFSAFGRPVLTAQMVTTRPVRVHLTGEDFVVVLPHGFAVTFE